MCGLAITAQYSYRTAAYESGRFCLPCFLLGLRYWRTKRAGNLNRRRFIQRASEATFQQQ